MHWIKNQHHNFDTTLDNLTHLMECQNGVEPIIGGNFNAQQGNRSHYGIFLPSALVPTEYKQTSMTGVEQ
jgi:hypothetical protein